MDILTIHGKKSYITNVVEIIEQELYFKLYIPLTLKPAKCIEKDEKHEILLDKCYALTRVCLVELSGLNGQQYHKTDFDPSFILVF